MTLRSLAAVLGAMLVLPACDSEYHVDDLEPSVSSLGPVRTSNGFATFQYTIWDYEADPIDLEAEIKTHGSGPWLPLSLVWDSPRLVGVPSSSNWPGTEHDFTACTIQTYQLSRCGDPWDDECERLPGDPTGCISEYLKERRIRYRSLHVAHVPELEQSCQGCLCWSGELLYLMCLLDEVPELHLRRIEAVIDSLKLHLYPAGAPANGMTICLPDNAPLCNE